MTIKKDNASWYSVDIHTRFHAHAHQSRGAIHMDIVVGAHVVNLLEISLSPH